MSKDEQLFWKFGRDFPKGATVEVIEDSKILVIGPETFETLLRGNLEIAFKMLKKMAARLRSSDEHLETGCLETKKEGR